MTIKAKLAKKSGQTSVSGSNEAMDKDIMASKAGYRRSKKYATITYGKGKNKKVVKRRNANQTGKVEGGKLYSETRENRTDKTPSRRY